MVFFQMYSLSRSQDQNKKAYDLDRESSEPVHTEICINEYGARDSIVVISTAALDSPIDFQCN
jgi:hypothetical protein